MGRPVEAAPIDEPRGEEAGDHRPFVDFGELENPILVLRAEQRRAIEEEAVEKRLGERRLRNEVIQKLVFEVVDPLRHFV